MIVGAIDALLLFFVLGSLSHVPFYFDTKNLEFFVRFYMNSLRILAITGAIGGALGWCLCRSRQRKLKHLPQEQNEPTDGDDDHDPAIPGVRQR